MKTIAILSDIHGNLPALEAVLNEPDVARADLVIVNGDLADGPFPVATLDRLAQLGDRGLGLRGNGDRWLVDAWAGRYRERDPGVDDMMRWAAGQLNSSHGALLQNLPLTRQVEHPGLGMIALCHATARSDNEMFLVDSSLDHAQLAFAGLPGDIVLLGHSHMPFDRLFDRRRFINGGSVGMPYGHQGASWIWIDGDITLRRTPYDVETAADRIAASGMPDVEAFLRDYVRTTYSDREALDSFHMVLKRQQADGSFD